MAKRQNSLEDSIIQDKDDNKENQTIDSKQSKINQLIDEIRHHRYLYYNKTPKITDAKFDELEDELRQLAPNHPVLNEIKYSKEY